MNEQLADSDNLDIAEINPSKDKRYKIYTLKELGPNYPIGIKMPDGTLVKHFEHRDFTFKIEKELEAIRKKGKGQLLGNWVNTLLSYMTKVSGNFHTDNKTDHDKTRHFSRMWAGDVLYQYIYLRVEALSETAMFELTCPYCKNQYKFPADLETTRVRCPVDLKEMTKEVELTKGIPYQGKIRKKVILGALTWAAYENLDLSNQAMSKQSMIRSSVVGLEGVETFSPIPDSSWDEVPKRDINVLMAAIDDHAGGPETIIYGTCDKCQADHNYVMDWGYDHFFGHSSQQVPEKG